MPHHFENKVILFKIKYLKKAKFCSVVKMQLFIEVDKNCSYATKQNLAMGMCITSTVAQDILALYQSKGTWQLN